MMTKRVLAHDEQMEALYGSLAKCGFAKLGITGANKIIIKCGASIHR